jgi:hypothetical protein
MPMAGVTAANYTEMAQQFILDNGNQGFVLLPDMHNERRIWEKYQEIKGIKWNKSIAWWLYGDHKYNHVVTLPSQWPWQFDRSVDEGMLVDDAREIRPWLPTPPQATKARPETMAAMREHIRKAGLDHLPETDLRRRTAVAEWSREVVKEAVARAFLNCPHISPLDPIRKGTPKGWTGLMPPPAQGTARAAWGPDPVDEQPAKPRWQYDPAKAAHYPMWWLCLTQEERWKLQAQGKAPKPRRGDDPLDDPLD